MRSPTRRDALLSAALFSGAAQDGVARSATRIRGFADPEMDFQLLRGLGVANYMGASVGEVLAACRAIKDGDPRTWPAAFVELGELTSSFARAALEKQHHVSARDHFQRASMVLPGRRVLRRPGHGNFASARNGVSGSLPRSCPIHALEHRGPADSV
jgi:hypothetical protein